MPAHPLGPNASRPHRYNGTLNGAGLTCKFGPTKYDALTTEEDCLAAGSVWTVAGGSCDISIVKATYVDTTAENAGNKNTDLSAYDDDANGDGVDDGYISEELKVGDDVRNNAPALVETGKIVCVAPSGFVGGSVSMYVSLNGQQHDQTIEWGDYKNQYSFFKYYDQTVVVHVDPDRSPLYKALRPDCFHPEARTKQLACATEFTEEDCNLKSGCTWNRQNVPVDPIDATSEAAADSYTERSLAKVAEDRTCNGETFSGPMEACRDKVGTCGKECTLGADLAISAACAGADDGSGAPATCVGTADGGSCEPKASPANAGATCTVGVGATCVSSVGADDAVRQNPKPKTPPKTPKSRTMTRQNVISV